MAVLVFCPFYVSFVPSLSLGGQNEKVKDCNDALKVFFDLLPLL